MEISTTIISSFSRLTIFGQHCSAFTAKCTNMQANHNSIKFIFFTWTLLWDTRSRRIRTMKERNHSLIRQLTEMKGTLSSKEGNWFLQGRDLVSLSWENGCLNDRPKTLSQEFIERLLQKCWVLLSELVLRLYLWWMWSLLSVWFTLAAQW